MKICHNCGSRANDDASFCTSCGSIFAAPTKTEPPAAGNGFNDPANNPTKNNPYAYYNAPAYNPDPYDHTNEFTPEDISENKIFAVCCYVLGVVGIIIGLLASNNSKFVRFHVRQALKIKVLSFLSGILALVLCWTVLAPLAAGVFAFILFVVKIIGFVNAWKGKAKELPVIRDFLN